MRTRTRANSTNVPAGLGRTYTAGGSVYEVWSDVIAKTYPGLSETISDELHQDRSVSGPCVHVKNTFTYGGANMTWSWPGYYALREGPSVCSEMYSAAGSTYGMSRNTDCPVGDWESWSGEAYQSMFPSNDGDFSLLNFIAELKDTVRMFDFWSSKLRSLSHNIANLHLNYSFGWRPFIGDLLALWNNLVSLDERYIQLQKGANKVIKRHYKRILGSPRTVTTSVPMYRSPPGSRIVTYSEVNYFATMHYRYRLPSDADQLRSKVRLFLDTMGVNVNPQIVWNAIPFSFVLDWVSNTGSFLRSLRTDNYGLMFELCDFCHTIKYKDVSESRNDKGEMSFSYSTEYYERRLAYPRTSLQLRGRFPSWGAVALATSLITSLKQSGRL